MSQVAVNVCPFCNAEERPYLVVDFGTGVTGSRKLSLFSNVKGDPYLVVGFGTGVTGSN